MISTIPYSHYYWVGGPPKFHQSYFCGLGFRDYKGYLGVSGLEGIYGRLGFRD